MSLHGRTVVLTGANRTVARQRPAAGGLVAVGLALVCDVYAYAAIVLWLVVVADQHARLRAGLLDVRDHVGEP